MISNNAHTMRIHETIRFPFCLLVFLARAHSQLPKAEPELKSSEGPPVDAESRDPVVDEASVEVDCKEEAGNPANPWFRASLHKLPLYQRHLGSGDGVGGRCFGKRTPAQIFSSGIPLGKSHSVDESVVESKETKTRSEIDPVKYQIVKETAVEERPLTFYQAADVSADSKNSAIVPEDILLVSTLEGSLTAVGKDTGVVRWNLRNEATNLNKNLNVNQGPILYLPDPVVKVPSEAKTSQIPSFLPDPKDGSLYMLRTGRSGKETLKKLPFTIPELVSASPTRTTDGVLYSGKKVDKWIAIDDRTGHAQEVSNFANEVCPFDAKHSLLVGRSDYTIMVLDSHNYHQSWNLTFSDYSANEMTAPMIEDYDLTHLAGSSDGYLLTLNRKDGKLQWKRDFLSPIVAIYLIQHEGLLRVPFTTLASDMLSGIISRLSVDVWKANFIGERKLLPTLYIGQSEHGLYALPAFVDESIVVISLGQVHPHVPLIEGPNNTEEELSLSKENTAQENLTNQKLDWVIFGHYEMPDFLQQTIGPAWQIEQKVSKVIEPSPKLIQHPDRDRYDPLWDDVVTAWMQVRHGNWSFLFSHDFLSASWSASQVFKVWLWNQENIGLKIIVALLILSMATMFLYLYPLAREFHRHSSKRGSRSASRGLSWWNDGAITAIAEEVEPGKIKVGKILFFSSHVLGKGCDGTFVYK
ncbi:unnamed protein product [Darwinula stevensoni]|uniref:Pyrrolo-quinoline quinone repeat domain-containing protein n=1 Tax=Darwinula stevensoni TaxID=69355 RepID=A0A7R9A2C3_9CRUS|nr:unnamed protein product [Darwinula stevensoni]CAG0888450.1 unnamed protein product [Darwinula stevensoni]